jgi:peptidoglycan glycosyltransferase
VNTQIRAVAVTAVVLIGALIVGTTYWQTWAAPGLADRQDNAIQRVAEFTIERGRILASDGETVLAGNEAQEGDGQTLYFRTYPQGDLAPHAVGYSTQVRSRAGLERSLNDYLTGANANLSTVLETTLDRLRGSTVTGNDVVLTLDARVQRVAKQALGGRCGAVVALEPATGRVLAMVSSPSYDPNLVERNFEQIEQVQAECTPASPLLNRATRGLYAPGSTFKVVTAAAALESGRWSAESTFNDPGYCEVYGRRVENYDTSRPFGPVNFVQAMQHSINSVFCNIGKELGPIAVLEQARDFGFYADPPLETPATEREASGLYDENGDLFMPEDPNAVDPGRLAFGQERLLVTPLQMAMVAAAVANDGQVMHPHLVDRVVGPNGSAVTTTEPQRLGRAISAENAAVLKTMMRAVVEGGTAPNAAVQGVSVAGKTGTAETGRAGVNTTSFIAFAPVERPRVAIAVFLEAQRGTGGSTAVPVAQAVLQALLVPPGS